MAKPYSYKSVLYWGSILICVALSALILFHDSLLSLGLDRLVQLSNTEKIRYFVASFGPLAPLAFIGLQITQVLISPLPGEATGFIGGYLFGAVPGFIYSTIGLTLGSWLAFTISRMFAPLVQRRFAATKLYKKFNLVVEHRGMMIAFIFFLLPGFPKDYLCYLLGLSLMPTGVFLAICTFGRMPGTLMLTLQGSKVFNQEYGGFWILLGISLAIAIPSYIFRERIISRLSKMVHRDHVRKKQEGQ